MIWIELPQTVNMRAAQMELQLLEGKASVVVTSPDGSQSKPAKFSRLRTDNNGYFVIEAKTV